MRVTSATLDPMSRRYSLVDAFMNIKKAIFFCLALHAGVAHANWKAPQNIASGVALTGGTAAIVGGIISALHNRAQKRRLKRISHLEHVLRGVGPDMRDFVPVRKAHHELRELKRSFAVAAASIAPVVAKWVTGVGGAVALGGAGTRLMLGRGGSGAAPSEGPIVAGACVTKEMVARLVPETVIIFQNRGTYTKQADGSFEDGSQEQVTGDIVRSWIDDGAKLFIYQLPLKKEFERKLGIPLKANDTVSMDNIFRLRVGDEVAIKDTRSLEEQRFKIQEESIYAFGLRRPIADAEFINFLKKPNLVVTITATAQKSRNDASSTSSGESGQGLTEGTWIKMMRDIEAMSVGQNITLFKNHKPIQVMQWMDSGKFIVIERANSTAFFMDNEIAKQHMVNLVGDATGDITARVGSYLQTS